MTIRPQIEAAVTATAERLSPGSGSGVTRELKNELAMVDGSNVDLARRFADEPVRLAVPAVFESKHLDGDTIEVRKRRDGLVVVFPDSILYVRQMGFGAREVKALGLGDLSVERVGLALDGSTLPGVVVCSPPGAPEVRPGGRPRRQRFVERARGGHRGARHPPLPVTAVTVRAPSVEPSAQEFHDARCPSTPSSSATAPGTTSC